MEKFYNEKFCPICKFYIDFSINNENDYSLVEQFKIILLELCLGRVTKKTRCYFKDQFKYIFYCFLACTNDKLHENSNKNLQDDPHISSLLKSSDTSWCMEVFQFNHTVRYDEFIMSVNIK